MGIGLDDVVIDALVEGAFERSSFDLIYKSIYLWLVNNEITNYLELEQKLMKYPPLSSDAYSILKKHLLSTERAFESAVFEEKITGDDIYCFDIYQDAGIDDKTVEATDSGVMGSFLIGISVINKVGGRKMLALDRTSILKMKYLLSHFIAPYFRNGASVLHIQKRTLPQYVASIEFYEQQVVRQWLETGQTGKNVFTIDFEQRRSLVIEQLPSIIEYILTGQDSIWEVLSPNKVKQLRLLGRRTPSMDGINVPLEQVKLINDIAGNVTLKEANSLFVEQLIPVVTARGIEYIKDKPINRFTKSLVRK